MKKRTKLLALVISVLMVTALLAGCSRGRSNEKKDRVSQSETEPTGTEKKSVEKDPNVNAPGVFPIVKEPIKLKFFITISDQYILEGNEWFDYIKDLANIEIEVDNATGNSGQQKINLLLASQSNLPDVFLTFNNNISDEQLALYGSQGVFVNLNEYSDLTPNLNKIKKDDPKLIQAITMDDGGVYSLLNINPSTHVQYAQRMWVNKTWLDKLGMKLPETIDEFYDMLKAFKSNDCNGNGESDEIPLAAFKTGVGFKTDLAGFLMNPFVPATDLNSLYTYNDNGTIKTAILQDGYKEGVRFLQKLYREKLLDEEIFTLTPAQIKTLTGNPTGNRVGAIQSGAISPFANIAVPGARDEFVALSPLKGSDGVRRTPYFKPYPQTRYTITTNCENIEAAVRLGDLFLTDPFSGNEKDLETYLNLQYGPNGWDPINDPNKKSIYGKEAKYAWTFTYGEPTKLNIGNLPNNYATDDIKSIQYDADSDSFSQEKILYDAAVNIMKPYAVDITVPPVLIPSEKTTDFAEYYQLSKDYYVQKMAEFIMGEKDIDKDWDKFISEIKSLGLKKYVQIIQEAYDARYK